MVMEFWPFEDMEVADSLADGLLRSGFSGSPGYYKVSEDNKLTGEEMEALTFGRTSSGFNPGTGEEWWIKVDKDGKTTRRGRRSDSGTTWIEGDIFWRQWQKGLNGHKFCITLFRNPEGTREMKNGYLAVTDLGIIPWSPVE